MGGLLAHAAARAGAEVVVASRRPYRAASLLRRLDATGPALDLEAAADRWASRAVDGVLVALGGPWAALAPALAPGADAGRADAALVAGRPPIVDCSAPSAVPGPIRRALGPRFVGIDELADGPLASGGAAATTSAELAYRDRAEALVSEGLAEYRSWLVARGAATAIRSLEARAEAIRAAEVDALLRRLPELGPRERDLVALHTRRIVARLLHPSIQRLRDGGGLAAIGERLDR
jgi:glutamyl-tRNA reductase